MAQEPRKSYTIFCTRIVETGIIGLVVLYGVVKTLEHQNSKQEQAINEIATELKTTRQEQIRRTLVIDQAWKHVHDETKHKNGN